VYPVTFHIDIGIASAPARGPYPFQKMDGVMAFVQLPL
jgi:hypothetical protein